MQITSTIETTVDSAVGAVQTQSESRSEISQHYVISESFRQYIEALKSESMEKFKSFTEVKLRWVYNYN